MTKVTQSQTAISGRSFVLALAAMCVASPALAKPTVLSFPKIISGRIDDAIRRGLVW
jgi:hypothetical protein